MLVFLRTMGGATISVDVEGGDTIEKVKHAVAEKEGAPAAILRITSRGSVLSDDAIVRDVVREGATLDVSVVPRPAEYSMSFSASLFDILPDDTVRVAKEKAACKAPTIDPAPELVGITPDRIRIVSYENGECELTDLDMKMSSAGVTDGVDPTLCLYATPPSE